MKFTEELVDSLADKLLIGLNAEENAMVLKEFSVVDANMEIIANIPGIEKVEPMTHALDDFVFELREDIKKESISIEEALQNCKRYDGREIEVPKVVE